MIIKYVQWSYGGLDIGTMMLLIEDSTEDDDKKLQSGISSLDACTQSSLFFSDARSGKLSQFLGNSGGVDECDTATQLMECGKNDPDMFNDMISAADRTAVV
jgi:hypothetical protein